MLPPHGRVDEPRYQAVRIRVMPSQRRAEMRRHHVDDVAVALDLDAQGVCNGAAAVRSDEAGLDGLEALLFEEMDLQLHRVRALLDADHLGGVKDTLRV